MGAGLCRFLPHQFTPHVSPPKKPKQDKDGAQTLNSENHQTQEPNTSQSEERKEAGRILNDSRQHK